MLDIKLFKLDLKKMQNILKNRGYNLDIEKFNKLDNDRNALREVTQLQQSQRNSLSKSIGAIKSKGGDIAGIKQEVSDINTLLKENEIKLKLLHEDLEYFMACIPNLPAENVPVGKSEDDNIEVKKSGAIKTYNFKVKDHVELGENLKGLDFAAATKITGSRFVVMKNKIAKLHRALIQFMLDEHTNNNDYQEIYVPVMVNKDSLYGTGQLPKFSDDLFSIQNENFPYYLIPTGEVPVTNLFRDTITDFDDLPIKLTTHTSCFRSEAGSYGRDTKGMIRQHQFEKIEMINIVEPDLGEQALEDMTECAANILEKLNLPYKVVLLCTGDMGFTAKRTYDLEVWLPSQNTYREISSCSWCGDFQARRMQARYRKKEMKKPELVHTLNGSGLAVGRTLVAILENYQQEDGSILIPKILQNYCGFDKITKENNHVK